MITGDTVPNVDIGKSFLNHIGVNILKKLRKYYTDQATKKCTTSF